MAQSIRHMLTQVFITVMMLVICLPCTTKRDIKSILGVPVSEINNSFQKVKTSCSSYTQNNTSNSISVSTPHLRISSPGFLSGYFLTQYKAVLKSYTRFSHHIYSPVRLHQLYEQYLI